MLAKFGVQGKQSRRLREVVASATLGRTSAVREVMLNREVEGRATHAVLTTETMSRIRAIEAF
jgi:hypothetical protein